MITAVESRQRVRLDLRGAVQGVGLRPYAFRLAESLGLTGRVRNTRQGAAIEIEGAPDALRQFVIRLRAAPPPIQVQEVLEQTLSLADFTHFSISESARSGLREAPPPVDLALCGDCLLEVHDPANRRHRYPFTACTACGPRYSIVESVPYDRERTTLRRFPLCSACRAEFENPRDRRFHAQAIACPDCGPHVELWGPDGSRRSYRDSALLEAAQILRNGKVLAVKGLGGFHLLVDARNERAVGELRQRKGREEKPFAVMFPHRATLDESCFVSAEEERLLASPEGPIVLLSRRPGGPLAKGVAPGNPWVGAFLPTTPLHAIMLSDVGFPVVATSGNRSDEPLCTDEREALRRLGGIADAFLVHNRPIVRPVEDSLARVVMGKLFLLRRARGYAPAPLPFSGGGPVVLALGGHLKNTIALGVRGKIVLGSHGGDLDTPAALDAYGRGVEDLPRLHGVHPAVLAVDCHPDYTSTRFARGRGEPARAVQHHHAHFASCLAEHGVDGPALGIIWDGSGWGPDGTVWGGEFLVGGRAAVRRFARLRPFPLPGGEAAVRDVRRTALGLLVESMGSEAWHLETVRSWFTERERDILARTMEQGSLSVRTSSMGRLFDGVSALLGVTGRNTFEGQAAMSLEFAAEDDEGIYPFPLREGDPMDVDWAPMLGALIKDHAGRMPLGRLAGRFHNTLVEMMAGVARRAGEKRIVLSGGCFQNLRLLTGAVRRLSAEGFEVLFHRRVPTNDGGLALGQAAVVRAGGGIPCA